MAAVQLEQARDESTTPDGGGGSNRARVVVLVVLVVLLAAVVIGELVLALRAGDQQQTAAPTVPYRVPTVTIDGATSGTIAWDHPLRIAVADARLRAVTVADDHGAFVPGRPDGTTAWRTDAALVPSAHYAVSVDLVDTRGREVERHFDVTTADAPQHLLPTLSPGDHAVVGVGMPVSVRFNRPVPLEKRAAVVARLSVSTSPPVTGAWHWMSATEVHWRPPTYWAPHTRVTVTADLARLDLNGSVWGDPAPHSTTFEIGDAHVSVADVNSHTMTVTSNGAVVRTLPISAGRDAYPTKGGVHIALEKSQVVTMDSATVGIPRNSPDGYYEKVYWDVRISYGGAFVHAAPWSVGSQGRRNVSHGCINLSTADAEWFFNFAQRGDIVDVHGSPAPPDLHDPGTADWNMAWEQWAAPPVATPATTPHVVTKAA